MIRYPSPSEAGGVLVRKVLKLFQDQGVPTPISDPVLIAVSGGVDSMTLAHLVGKYGRNLIDPKRVTLLHLDHGWRPESSREERDGVQNLAKDLGLGFIHETLESPLKSRVSENLEEDARIKRLQVYDRLAGVDRPYRFVLTGHHQDDVAETVLWRFLRGEFSVGNVGIKFHDDQCLRPFLEVTKELILQYAREEKIPYFEDGTNQDPARFRAWARAEVLPLLERFYPSVRRTLAGYAHHRFPESNKRSDKGSGQMGSGMENLLQAIIDGPLNRAQRNALTNLLKGASVGQAIFLPGGVQLKRMKSGWMIEEAHQDNQA